MTPDGSRVAFAREIRKPLPGAGPQELFLWRANSNSVRKITADGSTPTESLHPSIAADGKQIAFWTYHSFDAADTNARPDVYIRTL
jgi:Tol biopolymer transport system component